MKSILRRLAYATVLRPRVVKASSQTLYEAALGCVALFDATADEKWKKAAIDVGDRILRNQLPDGSFDIGYPFNFGLERKEKQGTAPESKSLIALAEVHRISGELRFKKAIEAGATWILNKTVWLDAERAYLPYCPSATRDVMVYNGVSFGLGGLASALKAGLDNPAIAKTMRGYIHFLHEAMRFNANRTDGYWFYSAVPGSRGSKRVDYYHQAQQIDCHVFAQSVLPDPKQAEMIEAALGHLLEVAKTHPIIPYYSDDTGPGAKISVWGLASVTSAFVNLPERLRTPEVLQVGAAQIDWIIAKSWTGAYFYETLALNGQRGHEGYRFYNPRSDAWVFEALARIYSVRREQSYYDLATKSFDALARCHYSGFESHAITRSKQALYFVTGSIAKLRGRAK